MDSSGHGYTLIGFNGAKTIEGPPPVSCEKPRAELTPASLAFGDQQVGTLSPVQTVTLANPGAAPLAITGIAASGDFRHNANCGSILAAYASCGIEVIFAPTASGSRAGSLTVVSDAAGSPHTIINLSGSGVEPLVDLSPGGLAFGEQQVGIPSAAQVITLTNTGTASLAIINIAILGDFAQNNDCGPALAPAASCRIHITFTPAANGNRGGELTLVTNAANSPHAVGLVGLGVAPAADLNPGSLAFGERQVGSAGSARIVALTNIGAAALSVNSITTTSGDFIQTNACGATLPPGGSCNISVTFKPTAGGARTGQLIIASNAGGSPHSVSLNGVGMQRFELKIKKYGNGDGAITSSPSGINCGKDCKETYPRNKKVKLIAKAKKGSTFQGWISACGGSASTCKVTLSQAKTVNVLFAKKNYYVLIVSTAGNGKGGVSSSPSGIKCKSTCSKSYRRDTQVKLTAKADRGSVFAGWSGSCSGKSKTCVVKLSKVRSVKANFKSRSKSSYDYWLDDALLQQDDQGPTDNLDPMAPASKEEEQP